MSEKQDTPGEQASRPVLEHPLSRRLFLKVTGLFSGGLAAGLVAPKLPDFSRFEAQPVVAHSEANQLPPTPEARTSERTLPEFSVESAMESPREWCHSLVAFMEQHKNEMMDGTPTVEQNYRELFELISNPQKQTMLQYGLVGTGYGARAAELYTWSKGADGTSEPIPYGVRMDMLSNFTDPFFFGYLMTQDVEKNGASNLMYLTAQLLNGLQYLLATLEPIYRNQNYFKEKISFKRKAEVLSQPILDGIVDNFSELTEASQWLVRNGIIGPEERYEGDVWRIAFIAIQHHFPYILTGVGGAELTKNVRSYFETNKDLVALNRDLVESGSSTFSYYVDYDAGAVDPVNWYKNMQWSLSNLSKVIIHELQHNRDLENSDKSQVSHPRDLLEYLELHKSYREAYMGFLRKPDAGGLTFHQIQEVMVDSCGGWIFGHDEFKGDGDYANLHTEVVALAQTVPVLEAALPASLAQELALDTLLGQGSEPLLLCSKIAPEMIAVVPELRRLQSCFQLNQEFFNALDASMQQVALLLDGGTNDNWIFSAAGELLKIKASCYLLLYAAHLRVLEADGVSYEAHQAVRGNFVNILGTVDGHLRHMMVGPQEQYVHGQSRSWSRFDWHPRYRLERELESQRNNRRSALQAGLPVTSPKAVEFIEFIFTSQLRFMEVRAKLVGAEGDYLQHYPDVINETITRLFKLVSG